jgi:hypothetical protein
MRHEVIERKPAYQKPTIEVLGSFAQLTLWGIDPNKWQSLADVIGGTAIADGGIGGSQGHGGIGS